VYSFELCFRDGFVIFGKVVLSVDVVYFYVVVSEIFIGHLLVTIKRKTALVRTKEK